MSSFGAKRKARIIKVSDDDDQPNTKSSSDDVDATKAGESMSFNPLNCCAD